MCNGRNVGTDGTDIYGWVCLLYGMMQCCIGYPTVGMKIWTIAKDDDETDSLIYWFGIVARDLCVAFSCEA